MSGKLISYGADSQSKIIEGVNKVADAVKISLGPAGSGVLISNDFTSPEISRDGATIAKSITFSDEALNSGARLVRDAASLSESQSGDSTTSTIVLAQELINKGQKAVQTGSNVNELKSGMLKAEKWIIDYISKNSIPVDGDFEKIRKVATISANNNPEIGDLIVKCMQQVGQDGIITADLGYGLDNSVDITTGMEINRGWANPQFVTSATDGKCVLENPYILVSNERISSINQIINVLRAVNSNPILIVANEIDDVVMNFLIINTLSGQLRCCVVKEIDFGDNRKNVMNDIAVATGAAFITPENNVSLASVETVEYLGTAKKVVVSRNSTVIFEGGGEKDIIEKRVEVLKESLNNTTSDFDKKKFEKRIASLAGGVAVIKVGGSTQVEQTNIRQVVEDAILASKCSIQEGVVPGCGYVYFHSSLDVEKDKAFWKSLSRNEVDGAKIVFSSLPVILKTVVSNAGIDSGVVLQELKKKKNTPAYGFNAKTKEYVNLIEAGVLDSAKCIRVALENAISTASMILTIGCVIVNEPSKDSSPVNNLM